MNLDGAGLESFCGQLDRLSLPRFATPATGGPWVVALEGPNGAGKSTLCSALVDILPAHGCLGTDAAWFSAPFKVRMIRDADWPASALFFLSGCLEQMRVLGRRSERLVIMDRSLWSTLAVHAATNPDRLETLLAVLAPLAGEIRVPHFTLVLDASFPACQHRIGRKTGTARALDDLTANAAFHARERAFYRWLGRQHPTVRFLGVDEKDPAEAAAAAAAMIRELVPC